MKPIVKRTLTLLFCAYILLMVWLMFGQRLNVPNTGTYWEQLIRNQNLIPFRTLIRYFRMLTASTDPALVRHAFINLGGNIGMFLPLGFFLPCFLPKTRHWGIHTLVCAQIMIVVELLQLVSLLGACDIDDLLLNLVGTSIGYAIFHLLRPYLSTQA